MKNILLLLLVFFSSLNIMAQKSLSLIKTTEFFDSQNKRRDLFLDSNLNLVKEIYYETNYRDELYKIAEIDYYENKKRKKVMIYNENKSLKMLVDFSKGIYNNYETRTFLNFNGYFNFDGLQRSGNTVVNYKNGKRAGRSIQTDSAVNGKKVILTQKADARLLQFDIIKLYNEPVEVSTYKLFNGIELNFVDDELNGEQKGFYSNGKIKFVAQFNNFRLINYRSFTDQGDIVTMIKTDSGLSKNNQIINGIANTNSSNKLYYMRGVHRLGKILVRKLRNQYSDSPINEYEDAPKYDESSNVTSGIKAEFDNLKAHFKTNPESEEGYSIMDVLEIPTFIIAKYDVEYLDDKTPDIIYINSDELSYNNIKKYPYVVVFGESSERYDLPLPFAYNREYMHLRSIETGIDNTIENNYLCRYLSIAFKISIPKFNFDSKWDR